MRAGSRALGQVKAVVRKGQDIAVTFPGLYLVHHNLPGKKADSHSHEEALLFLPLQGEIAVRTEDGTFSCGPGRMIFLPPAAAHSFDSSMMAGERLIALIDPKAWKRAGGRSHPASVLPASGLCKELLFQLLLFQGNRHNETFLAAFFVALSSALECREETGILDVSHLDDKSSDPRVRKAITALRAQLSRKASMDSIARASGLSVRSLNRLFLDELGLTPKQVLTHFRVRRAEELLLSGEKSVTETAYEVGYASLSQFITVFRQITGKLPSSYQK